MTPYQQLVLLNDETGSETLYIDKMEDYLKFRASRG